MKILEKKRAIALRKRGVSMGEIAKTLGVSKASVSYWVRDVVLTEVQRLKLNKNGHSVEAIERRRVSRMSKTQEKRRGIMDSAMREVAVLSLDPLWCVGVALYWGEGGKTQQTPRVANSDPSVVKIMMRFFKKYGSSELGKYRGHIHTFSHQNGRVAVEYWAKVSGIPKHQFFKTYVKQSSASKGKREKLPYGTLQIYLHDSNFFFKLMGWIEELKRLGDDSHH